MNEIEQAINYLTPIYESASDKMSYGKMLGIALDALKKNIEREKVVHCKDCKYLGIKDFAYGYCKKNMCGEISPNDFCSQGELK